VRSTRSTLEMLELVRRDYLSSDYRCSAVCCRAAELEVFESLGSKQNSASASVESVFASGGEVAVGDFKDVPATEVLSIVPFERAADGLATLNERSVSSLGNVSGFESVSSRAELLSAVQRSGRVEAQTVDAASELRDRVTNLLAPLEGALGAPGGWEHAAAAARLRSKREKIQRNRRWRKRKRQRVAEACRKVCSTDHTQCLHLYF
jgi:hypothetical protein